MFRSGWWCSRRPAERAEDGLSEAERFDHTAPLTVLINPEIEVVDPGAGRRLGGLSCPSPGLRGFVERPAHIRYRGFDHEGRIVERIAKGSMPASCSTNAIIWTVYFTRSACAI